MLIRRALVAAGVGAMVAASGPAAHAQLVNFAEFGRNGSTPTGGFTFTNSGATSTLGVLSGSIPVRFQYDTTNGYGSAFTSIPSTLTVSGVVSGPASVLGSTITQSFSTLSFTYSAITPVLGQTNLLTATFSAANGATLMMSGSQAGGSATFSATDTNNISGVSDYTSSFVNFTSDTFTSEQFSVSLSGVTNGTPPGGTGLTVAGNGYVNSFTSNATGTFSSNPVPASQTPPTGVPEPAALGLAATGLLGLVGGRRAQRRR